MNNKISNCPTSPFTILSLAVLITSFLLYNSFFPPSTNKITVARLAYYISGSIWDGERQKRLLQAVYHPYNFYIVHLAIEDRELSSYIDTHKVFSVVGNVKMIVGPQSFHKVRNLLHAAAILKEFGEWDWLINLDASDYPLITQDDLLHVLSRMPRHLNFIDHTNVHSRRQEVRKTQVVSTEEGEYLDFFAGSPWMALTRSFVEYCIWRGGDDFLLNKLPMHEEGMDRDESIYLYFQTVICNSQGFFNTTVNTDLRLTAGGYFTPRDPRFIFMGSFFSSLTGKAPFSRKFDEEYTCYMLDWIDRNLLSRGPDMLVPGGWCAGTMHHSHMRDYDSSTRGREGIVDPCLIIGDISKLQPGPGAIRLQLFLDQLVQNNGTVLSPQCVVFKYT